MKKAIKRTMQTGRMAVVILALLALLVSGASSAKRLFAGNSPAAADANRLDSAGLTPLPCPEELPENMEPSGQPNGEPSANLLSAAALSPNNSESQLPFCTASTSPDPFCQAGSDNPASIRSTAGRVSSLLALRATLVGARPSGTS